MAACAPAERDDGDAQKAAQVPTGSRVQMTTAEPTEGGTFQVLHGDTLRATVRYERTATTLLNEVMGGPDDERMSYTATLNRNGTVSRLQARLFARREDTEPAGRLNLVLRGDSMEVESLQPGDTVRDTVRIEPGSLPLPVAEDAAMVEQILRRARDRNRATVHLPIVMLEGGVRTGVATVEFMGRDSARITFRARRLPPPASAGGPDSARAAPPPPPEPATTDTATTEVMAATDSAGRLLGGTITNTGVRIRREP
jgi:hypothetical protein